MTRRSGPRSGRGGRRVAPPGRSIASAALLSLLLMAPARAGGQGVVSQREALRLAFPEPAEIERRTAFLQEGELRRAGQRAGPGVEVEEPVVTYYVATRGDSALGVAYFDAHPVRTLPEVLMIVVDPSGTVERVEVLKFDEPREYRPPDDWLEEYRGVALSGEPSPGDVVSITGATLTSRAVERAVRRTLALHEVIAPLGAGAADGSAGAGSGGDGAAGGGGGPGSSPGGAHGSGPDEAARP